MNSVMSPSVSTQRMTTAPKSAIESATAVNRPRGRSADELVEAVDMGA